MSFGERCTHRYAHHPRRTVVAMVRAARTPRRDRRCSRSGLRNRTLSSERSARACRSCHEAMARDLRSLSGDRRHLASTTGIPCAPQASLFDGCCRAHALLGASTTVTRGAHQCRSLRPVARCADSAGAGCFSTTCSHEFTAHRAQHRAECLSEVGSRDGPGCCGDRRCRGGRW